MTVPRRDFLALAAITAGASGGRFSDRGAWSLVPGDVVPEMDEELARRLALAAIEAARAAGAQFADVRVSGRRTISLVVRGGATDEPGTAPPYLGSTVDYGVRVLVDGMWGFAGGFLATPDAVADTARTAIVRARSNRARRPRRVELAPAPRVENGRWATPIDHNPFAISVADQIEEMAQAVVEGQRVRGVSSVSASTYWQQTLHVFASTEGSTIVQRLSSGGGDGTVYASARADYTTEMEKAEGLRSGGYGYEAVRRRGLDTGSALRAAVERAVARSGPPGPAPTSVEVGRYDLVFTPGAVRALVSDIIGPALNLERALGYRANSVGTSFAAPPLDILGTYQLCSPLVTLRADRTRPHAYATVGWDDEGVAASEFTLIDKGVIVEYLTSRQTAPELGPYYRAKGADPGSRGCMVGVGQTPPEVASPNLALDPGPEALALDDIVADTKRGFLVSDLFGATDQQLFSGQYVVREVREIRGGKVGRKMKDFAFQFLTSQFWKKIDVLGGPESVTDGPAYPGHMRAVPLRVREVNVLNTGITL